jgi:rhodanese-related sulfurtransferase
MSPLAIPETALHGSAMDSDWLPILVAAAFLALLAWFRRGGQVRAGTAIELLKNGAAVVDVRTPPEFNANPLPGAINLPLDRVSQLAPQHFPDKGTILMLHCRSGGRSLIARGILRRRGYTQVYNLGSLARARALLEQCDGARRERSPTSADH